MRNNIPTSKGNSTSRHILGSHVESLTKQIKQKDELKTFLVHKRPLLRLIIEIAHDFQNEVRFQSQALVILQQALEAYLETLLCDTRSLALHAKRITLLPKDVDLVRSIRGELS